MDAAIATTVDLTPLIQAVAAILATVLSAVATLGIRYLSRKLNLEQETVMIQQLETIAKHGINLAANRLVEQGQDLAKVEVRNQLLAAAAQYVTISAPAAVAKLKLETRLTDYLEARIVENPAIPTSFMPK